VAILTIAGSEQELTPAAAERITAHVERAIAERGSAVVALTGGSTPRHLYEALADPAKPWRARIEWSRVHLFWGDERHVPPDHRDSNFRMADEALVRRVPIPASQVHRMRGELADAAQAAREYDHTLRIGFVTAGRADATFDVMLLGVGEDAHIASIFPGSELLPRHLMNGRPTNDAGQARAGSGTATSPGQDHSNAGRGFTPRRERVAAVWAEHLDAWRITLTPSALLDSRAIVMLVSGDKKAPAVHAAIEGPPDVQRWPAQLLREANDRVEWLVDRAAASLIDAAR
jgi:6-phosphogluconolactonase